MKKTVLAMAAFSLAATVCADPHGGRSATGLSYTSSRHEMQTDFSGIGCWVPKSLKGPAAVYVHLEQNIAKASECLAPLMESGTIPQGMIVSLSPGWCNDSAGRGRRWMRAVEFDSAGPSFPDALVEEIIPFCARTLGVTVDPSPDRHFITGASSGGFAAFNACWYRNDFFRRCYCNSPTFSNIRAGNTLMPLVRKSESRPIRVWISVGTTEPDYFFGDSYLVAADAASALRFAGYEVRYDRLANEGHGARFGSVDYTRQVMTWLFEDWKKKGVTVTTDQIRVRDLVKKGDDWRECAYEMPPPVLETRSTDGWRAIYVSPTNRFIMTARVNRDGSRDQVYRMAPLELAWNVSRPGGKALAQLEDGRILVATELGVQGAVPFGILDLVLPLPGDLPCDNLTVAGDTLYAASGRRVFRRTLAKRAADPAKTSAPTTPGYADGFGYSRRHEPSGGMAEMLGSYITAGRIAGVVSVLSDADYNIRADCAGWAVYEAENRRPMTVDTLFAVFSMTKTFTGTAIMCAIDEGKMSLDDEVAKYLPEFADVKMKDGSKPKRPLVIRDLMSHVSGFRGGIGIVNRAIPLREVARGLAAQKLEEQPGETFSYGNSPICAAAACLEVAVGEPYEKYLKRKVLDPLGMKDTTFTPSEEQLKRLVCAYNSDDTKLRRGNDSCTPQLEFPKKAKLYPAASAGLFSTPADMIRFSQMLAHHGTWKGRTVISRRTFDTVFAVKQTPDGIDNPYTVGSWIYGDWFGHEGAMRTDQRANLRTGHARVFFIQTENRAGSAFFQLKRDWHREADKIQGTPETRFGN